ncbi:hypothetical protein RCC89_01945 [Cytophagaceae bacterium ABcell3]|nr:hypothetical protein RCC89_01945 [Cytophagaceae bacterium ABcell3]
MKNKGQSANNADVVLVLVGAGLVAAGFLVKILYTGATVDAQAVSLALGSPKPANILAIAAILIMKLAASSFGYLLFIISGLLLIFLNAPFEGTGKKKKQ